MPCPSYRRQKKVGIRIKRSLRKERSALLEQAENQRDLRARVGQMLDHISEMKNISPTLGAQFSRICYDQNLATVAVPVRDALIQFNAGDFPPLFRGFAQQMPRPATIVNESSRLAQP